jgi:hypothetical protein
MFVFRSFSATLAAVMASLALVSCGGGGGGAASGTATTTVTTTSTPKLGATNTDHDTIILAVAAYDANAAFDRMLSRVGVASFTGAGALTVTPCAGGGSMQTQKVSGVYTLVATNCKLVSGDPLVYNGTWTINMDGPGFYSADGSCPGGSCTVGGSFAGFFYDHGKFGYNGTADKSSYNGRVTSATASGTQTVTVSLPAGATIIESIGLVLRSSFTHTIPGSLSSTVSVDLGNGTNILALATTNDRQTMKMTAPFKADITFSNTGVTASIDKDNNGVAESTITIPWTDIP